MELTSKRRKETGAFYTPKVWADMAVSYLKDFLGEDLSGYIFWDCAGGEGALLEALPTEVRRIGTTLEEEDVAIMRSKGIEAYQFDFLDDDLEGLPFWEEIQSGRERLVVFTNPPYMRLKSTHQARAKEWYNCNDAESLFIYRICLEIAPRWLGIFTKSGTIQVQKDLDIDTGFLDFFAGGFASCSKQGWGLSGNFGILFSLFDFSKMRRFINSQRPQYGQMEGLYYTYWSEYAHASNPTRTDLENLGRFVEKLHIFYG